MKCSLGISIFLEEISSLSHSVVFLYFFALIAEEGFLKLTLITVMQLLGLRGPWKLQVYRDTACLCHTQTSTQGWARGPPAVTTRGTLAWKTSGLLIHHPVIWLLCLCYLVVSFLLTLSHPSS